MKFVQQPSELTCTSACVSMMTGIPVEQVVEELDHVLKENGGGEVIPYLMSKGFEYESPESVYQIGGSNGIGWLLAVPSLNMMGGMHNIVAFTEGGKVHILDPNKGREDTKYYESVYPEDITDGHLLTAFFPEIQFILSATNYSL